MKHRMGQSLNIDWTIGMGLFLLTALTAILFLTNSSIGPNLIDSLESKTVEVQSNLEDEAAVEGARVPLTVRGPFNITGIPVDRGYTFPESAAENSEGGDIPFEVNFSSGEVVTVTEGGNISHHLVYFNHSVKDLSYSNDIETGNWVNNSNISAKPERPGLTSLQIEGQEVLSPDADLDSSSYSIGEEELYAETLSGDLRVYNGSREIILDDRTGNVTFDLKNFTTLYWYGDNSTTDLAGTGTKKQGKTKGLSVASGYGITFMGDLTSTVSMPDKSTVRVEIDAEKIRIRLHDSDYHAGRKRIRFYDKGYIVLSAKEDFSSPYSSEIENLESMSTNSFEDTLVMEGFNYNISFGEEGKSYYLERGDPIPLDESTVVSERPSALIDRNGSFAEIQNRVVLWN